MDRSYAALCQLCQKRNHSFTWANLSTVSSIGLKHIYVDFLKWYIIFDLSSAFAFDGKVLAKA